MADATAAAKLSPSSQPALPAASRPQQRKRPRLIKFNFNTRLLRSAIDSGGTSFTQTQAPASTRSWAWPESPRGATTMRRSDNTLRGHDRRSRDWMHCIKTASLGTLSTRSGPPVGTQRFMATKWWVTEFLQLSAHYLGAEYRTRAVGRAKPSRAEWLLTRTDG